MESAKEVVGVPQHRAERTNNEFRQEQAGL